MADLLRDAAVTAFPGAVCAIDQRDSIEREAQRRLVRRQSIDVAQGPNRSENRHRSGGGVSFEVDLCQRRPDRSDLG
jgi:hypothetical protein